MICHFIDNIKISPYSCTCLKLRTLLPSLHLGCLFPPYPARRVETAKIRVVEKITSPLIEFIGYAFWDRSFGISWRLHSCVQFSFWMRRSRCRRPTRRRRAMSVVMVSLRNVGSLVTFVVIILISPLTTDAARHWINDGWVNSNKARYSGNTIHWDTERWYLSGWWS